MATPRRLQLHPHRTRRWRAERRSSIRRGRPRGQRGRCACEKKLAAPAIKRSTCPSTRSATSAPPRRRRSRRG
eukprot:6375270-Heterocapsa_arctica.AAC.1